MQETQIELQPGLRVGLSVRLARAESLFHRFPLGLSLPLPLGPWLGI